MGKKEKKMNENIVVDVLDYPPNIFVRLWSKVSVSSKIVLFFFTAILLTLSSYFLANMWGGLAFILPIFVGYLMFLHIKKRLKIRNQRKSPVYRALETFIFNNGLYELDNGNVCNAQIIAFNQNEKYLSVLFLKRGDKFQNRVCDWASALSSALGLELHSTEENISGVIYNFYLEKPKAIKVEKISDLKSDSNSIVLYDDIRIPYSNLIICGGTGSGKTVLCNYIISSFLVNRNGSTILFADGKRSDSYMLCKKLGLDCATTGEELLQSLELWNKILDERMNLYESLGEYEKTLHELGMPSVFIVIDELASLLAELDSKRFKAANDRLGRLLSLGRQLSLHVIIISQHIESTVLSTRNKLQCNVIGCGNLSDIQRGIIFNNDNKEISNKFSYGGLISINGNTPNNFASPYCSISILEEVIRENMKTPAFEADMAHYESIKKELDESI